MTAYQHAIVLDSASVKEPVFTWPSLSKLKYSDETVRVQGKAEKDLKSDRLIARDGDKITGELSLDKIESWWNEVD